MSSLPFEINYVEDSFKSLVDVKAGSYDHIYTDPPFPEHVQNNLFSGSLVGKLSVPKRELSFAPLTTYGFIADSVLIAKRWCIIHCALEDFGNFKTVAGAAYVRSACWYKANAMGQLTRDRPASAVEGIAWMLNPECGGIAWMHNPEAKKVWNGAGSFGIWKCNSTRGKEGRHPNEKPVDLLMKVLALATNRGDSVFDPFCGSAAIGEACYKLGRYYVGWDNDKAWTEKSYDRLLTLAAHEAFGSVTDEYALTLCSMKDGTAPASPGHREREKKARHIVEVE